MHLLLVDAPDRSIPVDGIFHARASTAQAFCLLVHFELDIASFQIAP